MRKLIISPLLLFFTGCSFFETPEVVYRDLNLIKENVLIQKRVTDTLLGAVQPQNDRQVESLAMKRLDVEQRFDRMASGLNRLVTYFKAEREVGYLINVLDFMQESRLRSLLLSQAEREEYNVFEKEFQEAFIDGQLLVSFDDFDRWMLSSTACYR
jgi:hypothetical protein